MDPLRHGTCDAGGLRACRGTVTPAETDTGPPRAGAGRIRDPRRRRAGGEAAPPCTFGTAFERNRPVDHQ